jgi:hypothetical protein
LAGRSPAGITPELELFVWVDECGTHLSMTCTRARAPRGEERAYGKAPRNRGPNGTLVASMTLEGAMGASMAFVEGAATDEETFEAYVEHFLAPTPHRGRIVVRWTGSGRTARGGRAGSSKRGARSCGLCPPTRRISPYRGSVLQSKDALKEGGSAHARGAFRGDS